ncbi:hypothetical protein [Pedobacter sp. Hv1]|uniref:hypothetical protein n=1 Tax=Pedobacter sp. Hv1 TaxID=1740090 RepID=UPI0006D8ACAF|nr:hypothetical protein [Pedobacter sp. Hv1]KQC02759.1 hypothetical protein AQF98_04070 [Pedobacter sp. Hv1]
MKKLVGILGLAMIASTVFFSAKANDTSLAGIVASNTLNAQNNPTENDTDCDYDPNDTCWNAETGQKIPDCDTSIFWDTCGDVDTETLG